MSLFSSSFSSTSKSMFYSSSMSTTFIHSSCIHSFIYSLIHLTSCMCGLNIIYDLHLLSIPSLSLPPPLFLLPPCRCLSSCQWQRPCTCIWIPSAALLCFFYRLCVAFVQPASYKNNGNTSMLKKIYSKATYAANTWFQLNCFVLLINCIDKCFLFPTETNLINICTEIPGHKYYTSIAINGLCELWLHLSLSPAASLPYSLCRFAVFVTTAQPLIIVEVLTSVTPKTLNLFR